jgi:serine protease Do
MPDFLTPDPLDPVVSSRHAFSPPLPAAHHRTACPLVGWPPARWLLGLMLSLSTWPAAIGWPVAVGQESSSAYQSRRVAEGGLAMSRESLGTVMPELRGTPTGESTSLSVEQMRQQSYSELAEDYALIDRLGNLVKRVARVVKPSVIHIEARKVEKTRGRTEAFDEAGAGVVVEIAGQPWALTNRHVILGAEPAEILIRTSDGRQLRPSRVISDPSTDVAVMKLDVPVPLAQIGRSDSVEVGDFVLAVGSPFGLSHSVTFGILSAQGRRDLTLGTERIELQDFFQTDAAINPGNSGGPLLNLRGEVVGINTAIASSSGGSEGIGFAIPIDMAMRVAEELVRYGSLRRGYVGVTLDPDFKTTDSIRTTGWPYGALVKEVRPGSPAERARLRRGDVIIEFGGTQIENDDHLVTCVGLATLDQEVPVIIFRDGQRYRTTLTVVPLR